MLPTVCGTVMAGLQETLGQWQEVGPARMTEPSTTLLHIEDALPLGCESKGKLADHYQKLNYST